MSSSQYCFTDSNKYQYTYYTVAALGFRVPNAVKRTLTTMQITQFLVGSTFAAIHLFVSYTVPVSIAHNISEKIAVTATPSSVSSIVASATSSVVAALPTATGAAVAFLRKLIYRAAGDEGLAENIAVPGQPAPSFQPRAAEHPIEHFFHQTHETVNRIVYRNEYQSVPCIDTSGQAFAIYLNLIYLAPLTFLFMRFFFKSYLRTNQKGKPKRNSFSKATRDASEEVKRELESLDRAAEDGISSAVNRSKDAIRGRKINANGVDKDDRHGSLSPANKKFVDNVNRKVTQRLQEISESAGNTGKKLKEAAKDAGNKVTEQARQAKNTAEKKVEETEAQADKESKSVVDATQEKAEETKEEIKSEANKADAKSDEWQTASKKDKKSKLPQKKKERKETEESGVLVKKEDADEEVAKPEKEAEPKDINNTLGKDEGKGLF